VIIGFVVAHTTNWLTNGHLAALLKNFGFVRTDARRFEEYVTELGAVLSQKDWVRFAAIYGSHARREPTEESDIDIRLVRWPGLRNAVLGCVFVWRLRFSALIECFPLDIYIFDSMEALRKLDILERPIALVPRR